MNIKTYVLFVCSRFVALAAGEIKKDKKKQLSTHKHALLDDFFVLSVLLLLLLMWKNTFNFLFFTTSSSPL